MFFLRRRNTLKNRIRKAIAKLPLAEQEKVMKRLKKLLEEYYEGS